MCGEGGGERFAIAYATDVEMTRLTPAVAAMPPLHDVPVANCTPATNPSAAIAINATGSSNAQCTLSVSIRNFGKEIL